MLVLTAAVVLVGTLCLLNLVLTLAVIGRLREQSTRLERRDVTLDDATTSGLPSPGRAVDPFSVTTVGGEPVSLDGLTDHTVVVFLAPDCGDCREKVPELVRWATGHGRERTLVVIDGRGADPADVAGPLEPVATVVIVESWEDTVIEGFGVNAFPSFCVIADGKVVAASVDFSRLPAAVTA